MELTTSYPQATESGRGPAARRLALILAATLGGLLVSSWFTRLELVEAFALVLAVAFLDWQSTELRRASRREKALLLHSATRPANLALDFLPAPAVAGHPERCDRLRGALAVASHYLELLGEELAETGTALPRELADGARLAVDRASDLAHTPAVEPALAAVRH